MTDRKQALQDLLAKVEAGEFDTPAGGARAPLFNKFMDIAEIALPQNVTGCCALAWRAYNQGSLDAAKALHEAVLPGWTMDQMNEWHENGRSKGWVVHLLRHDDPKMRKTGSGFGISPARAWLIAILKALIAQEGET